MPMMEAPPTADTPDGARWWARECANYGGLERAFNDAADEIDRLLRGLNIIAQAGALHGGSWCVAQAIACRDNLDFDQFPESGKAPV